MSLNNYFSIAIDGPSGAGKSTLAKQAAKKLGFIYVDTGAIYRTVGLAVKRKEINSKDETAIKSLLPQLTIKIEYNESGEQHMLLNGEDVSAQIRYPEISIYASDVASLPAVRAFLLTMQRQFAENNDVIMDGRDIGTVVLPQANLKIFLSASAKARAERRLLELQQKGIEADFDSVLKDIEYRDKQDTERAAAPLKAAEDAVMMDNSRMTLEEELDTISGMVEARRR